MFPRENNSGKVDAALELTISSPFHCLPRTLMDEVGGRTEGEWKKIDVVRDNRRNRLILSKRI
jgi:hypothetical protein